MKPSFQNAHSIVVQYNFGLMWRPLVVHAVLHFRPISTGTSVLFNGSAKIQPLPLRIAAGEKQDGKDARETKETSRENAKPSTVHFPA
ncbi:MAG: hypothetical protein DMG12_25075 [Acidobacteria bacterium]|nr:MAG: hypothetical protein DMG12_25075 [Acidobacteriota bacterium]